MVRVLLTAFLRLTLILAAPFVVILILIMAPIIARSLGWNGVQWGTWKRSFVSYLRDRWSAANS